MHYPRLFIACIVFIPASAGFAAKPIPGMPAIYIEYENNKSAALIPQLKSQYNLCVSKKRSYQQIKQQGIAWDAARNNLPPGYIVSGIPNAEPDWLREKVGIFTEKQYHFGDKYAHYKYRIKYEFSDDGLCRLIKHESLNIEQDNGVYRYLITLKEKIPAGATPGTAISLASQYKHKKIRRMQSRALTRRQTGAELSNFFKDKPELGILVTRGLADTSNSRTPGTSPQAGQSTIDLLDKTWQISVSKGSISLPQSNGEHIVLNQLCDIVSSKTIPARTWLWQKMNKYPGSIHRDIILKTEATPFGAQTASIKEAVRFIVSSSFEDTTFEPEPGLLKKNSH
jgi:hypothetical protein